MNKLIMFGIVFLVSMFFLAPYLGLGGSLLTSGLLALGLALALDFFGVMKVFPFKLKASLHLPVLVLIFGFLAWQAGWLASLGGLFPGTVAPTPGPAPITPSDCRNSVSADIRGKAATISFNGWDKESNTPYSSPVDFSTNCWIYKNGKGPTDFINTTTSTSGGALTGIFSVGDVLYLYCGGTTYYGNAMESICIDTETKTVNIDAHTIVSETDLQITGYDSTGSAALSTGVNGTDYYMTMGADAEESFYAKLKVNVANKAYSFAGWATYTYYNISSVVPVNDDLGSSYSKVATPEHLDSIAVLENDTATSSTQTGDYSLYKIGAPKLLSEWDSVKTQFTVETSTNDPLGALLDHLQGKVNGFAILSKDATWSRGGDGITYLDAYSHDASESDVGLAETETSPAGKTAGMVVEVR